jgi:hypothetical protein
MGWLILFIFIGIIFIVAHHKNKQQKAEQVYITSLAPFQRDAYLTRKTEEKAALARRKQDSSDAWHYGTLNSQMICQHCGFRGRVRTQRIRRKQGISGGKATAALLTGGVSLLATGLSRKVANTQAHCGNCRNVWHF